MTEQDQQWALFWCHVLHPVIFGEVEAREVNAFLRQLAQQERVFPDGQCKKPSYSTLKRKLKLYREGGFDALARKPRKDRGRPRVVPPEVIATAVEAKREQPRRSHEAINRILLERHGVGLSRSTYYRHLKQAGATRLKLGIGKQPVRKRWTREHTHDLWLGDFEEGPYVRDGTDTAPTHLCAFIDCHSSPYGESMPVTTCARPWTSSSTPGRGPSPPTAPRSSSMWTTPKSTTPEACAWLVIGSMFGSSIALPTMRPLAGSWSGSSKPPRISSRRKCAPASHSRSTRSTARSAPGST